MVDKSTGQDLATRAIKQATASYRAINANPGCEIYSAEIWQLGVWVLSILPLCATVQISPRV